MGPPEARARPSRGRGEEGALVSAYNAFVADWVRDRDSNRAEYDRLHKEIDRAIASRKKEDGESIFHDD